MFWSYFSIASYLLFGSNDFLESCVQGEVATQSAETYSFTFTVQIGEWYHSSHLTVGKQGHVYPNELLIKYHAQKLNLSTHIRDRLLIKQRIANIHKAIMHLSDEPQSQTEGQDLTSERPLCS